MQRIIKLVAILGVFVALGMVFAPGLWPVSHTQALTNVILGQFAVIATGHTAYRIASGKLPSLRSAVGGIVCGLGIAVSPILLGPVAGFTTVTMFGGAFVAAIAVYGIVKNVTGEEEQRIPDLSTEQTPEPEESPPTA